MPERDERNRFLPGNTECARGGRARAARLSPEERSAIAAKGYKTSQQAFHYLRALMVELWERRASVAESGGYTIAIDTDLAERITEALAKSGGHARKKVDHGD